MSEPNVCGCPDMWLAEHADASAGAWVRRVLGQQAVGDFHATPSGGVHVWTGSEWLVPVPDIT